MNFTRLQHARMIRRFGSPVCCDAFLPVIKLYDQVPSCEAGRQRLSPSWCKKNSLSMERIQVSRRCVRIIAYNANLHHNDALLRQGS